jgi:hypothetical protein
MMSGVADGQLRPGPTKLVVGCSVVGDPDARVYELRRQPEAAGAGWLLMMRSRKAGAAPVVLPLPDARPDVTASKVTLSYATLNGGRHVEWSVASSVATLDVHANFELEVNIEPDLDPRVELMNTDGPITTLTCAIGPTR